MYRIFADDNLIYDSTLEDYKIAQGAVTLEADKSGSFVFAVYPDHPYYDRFVRLRTVITVYKSGRIVFRGRVLSDVTNYQNLKTLTCVGELDFLQDSIVRPYEFTGSHVDLFAQFIADHNDQVDEFKRFKVGTVTVVDSNNYVNRSGTGYDTTLGKMQSALIDSALGGHFFITHGDDGTDPIPTLHYLADFTGTASQTIEFGENLRDYVKTVNAETLATAVIPLGIAVDDVGTKLTIADVNNGVDYVYSEAGVALHGWIFTTAVWEDVTLAVNLKKKAEAYLEHLLQQNTTITLNAIDLHLLDRSIESIRVCDYVCVRSEPHNVDTVMLCNKQTMDLLKPENDTVVLGYQTPTFTGRSIDMSSAVAIHANEISSIKQDAKSIKMSVEKLDEDLNSTIEQKVDEINLSVSNLSEEVNAQLALKVGKDENDQVVSMLNASADVISLKSNRLEVDSDNFKLSADGELIARKATIQNEGSEYSTKIGDGQIHVTGPYFGSASSGYVKYRVLTFAVHGEGIRPAKCGLYVSGSVYGDYFLPVSVSVATVEEEENNDTGRSESTESGDDGSGTES